MGDPSVPILISKIFGDKMQEKDIKIVSSAGPYAALRLTLPAESCRRKGIVRGTVMTVRETKTGFLVVKK